MSENLNSPHFKVQNFINGKFSSAVSTQTLNFFNPAKNQILGTCPDSQAEDVQNACLAAEQAFQPWSQLDQRARSEFLFKIAELLEKNAERFAIAESQNTGKTVKHCIEVEIPRSALNLRFFAELSNQWASEFYQTSPALSHHVLRQALGVVTCISPWNLPLYLFTWKIAPALALGNCVIAKPSEVTPLTASLFAELCLEAKLPAGVLNILHGTGANLGATLCSHPKIKAISFTGSTHSGRNIAITAAPYFKKLSLEMGGKNSSIVFASSDLEKAANGVLRSAFLNQGQICLCGSRILIEESVYEPFKKLLLEKIKIWKVGRPESSETLLGSLVSENHFNKVSRLISQAIEQGAKVLCGAQSVKLATPYDKGFFYAPTLLEGLTNENFFNQEEVFGPVATLQKFSSESEAIALSNQSPYGLSSSVWTQDLNQANRVAQKLEVGMLWINTWMARDLRTPFGGVKNSGLGREGGIEALRFFSEAKTVSIQY